MSVRRRGGPSVWRGSRAELTLSGPTRSLPARSSVRRLELGFSRPIHAIRRYLKLQPGAAVFTTAEARVISRSVGLDAPAKLHQQVLGDLIRVKVALGGTIEEVRRNGDRTRR